MAAEFNPYIAGTNTLKPPMVHTTAASWLAYQIEETAKDGLTIEVVEFEDDLVTQVTARRYLSRTFGGDYYDMAARVDRNGKVTITGWKPAPWSRGACYHDDEVAFARRFTDEVLDRRNSLGHCADLALRTRDLAAAELIAAAEQITAELIPA